MKSISCSVIAISVATLFSASAFAQTDSAYPKVKPEVTTPKTRAEVKADTAKAKKEGQLNQSANANPTGSQAGAGEKKTRPEVKAETASAKSANGGTLKTPKE